MSTTPPSWDQTNPKRAFALSTKGGFTESTGDSELLEATKEAFRKYRHGGSKLSDDDLRQVWTLVTNILQGSDLCINFNAFDFFSMPVGSEPFKTEHITTALNYGRQPHGPRPRNGMSFFILRDELKKAARYFIRAAVIPSHIAAAKDQVSYDALGSIYGVAAKHNEVLRHALDKVCFHDSTLQDNFTDESDYALIEAHISDPNLFTCGIREIHLSPLHSPSSSKTEPPLSGQVWADIQRNAQLFANKCGGQVNAMDAAGPDNSFNTSKQH